jgi:LEA14-like dessication related protein
MPNNIINWTILFFVLASCRFQQPALKKYEGIELGKMDAQKVSFAIKASIYNPNWFAFKIKPSFMEISTIDGKLGVLHLDEKIKIKRKKETAVIAPMHIDLEKGIIMKIMAYSLRDSIKINLKGEVRGGVFIISKTIPMELSRTVSPKVMNPFKRN